MENILKEKSNTTQFSKKSFDLDAFFRRSLDILASAFGLLLLSPLFLFIALAIKKDSPGPVFYKGRRVGKDGVVFGIMKFRTMYERPDSYRGPKVTAAGDARITPIGKWLRDSKLNELPQLWNVLVGDMALVGPRPEDPELSTTWPIDARKEMLSVRPGITSPATVIYRGEESILSSSNLMDDYLQKIMPDKLRIDRLYLRNRTILTDLDVLLMTVILLLPLIKRVEVPHTFLYWGPVARFTSRFLSWFLIDVLVASLAMGMTGLIWRLDQPLDYGPVGFLAFSFGIGTCFSLINYVIGLQHIAWRRAPAHEIVPLGLSAALSIILIQTAYWALNSYGAVYGLHGPKFPSGMLVMAGMFAFLGFAAARYRDRLLTGLATTWLHWRGDHQVVGERVLLVGAGNNSRFAVWLLTRPELARAFHITGMVDDDPRKQGMDMDGVPVMGLTRDVPKLVRDLDVGLLVYTITNVDDENRLRILETCRSTNLPVVLLPDVMDDLVSRFQVMQGPVTGRFMTADLPVPVSLYKGDF